MHYAQTDSRTRIQGGWLPPQTTGGQPPGEHICTRGPSTQRRTTEMVHLHSVEVEDAHNWVTVAKNTGKWHLGVEKGRKSSRTRCIAKKNASRTSAENERLLRRAPPIGELPPLPQQQQHLARNPRWKLTKNEPFCSRLEVNGGS